MADLSCTVRPDHRAWELLEAILAEFAKRNVKATTLNLIAAATDAGADDQVAAAVAALLVEGPAQ